MARFAGQGPILFGGDTSLVDSSKSYPLGTRGRDAQGNEFVYLQGAALTIVAGVWVHFNESYAVSALIAGNAVGPVAIAMASVNTASLYGWFQIYGVNTIASTDTVATDLPLYIDGTAGRADDAVVAGDRIIGALSMTADTANVATVYLQYPFTDNVQS